MYISACSIHVNQLATHCRISEQHIISLKKSSFDLASTLKRPYRFHFFPTSPNIFKYSHCVQFFLLKLFNSLFFGFRPYLSPRETILKVHNDLLLKKPNFLDIILLYILDITFGYHFKLYFYCTWLCRTKVIFNTIFFLYFCEGAHSWICFSCTYHSSCSLQFSCFHNSLWCIFSKASICALIPSSYPKGFLWILSTSSWGFRYNLYICLDIFPIWIICLCS